VRDSICDAGCIIDRLAFHCHASPRSFAVPQCVWPCLQHYTSVCEALLQLASRQHTDPATASATLLSTLQRYTGSEFTTSLEEDAALQARIAQSVAEGRAVDSRYLFALEYRMQRKDTHMLAAELLQLIVGGSTA
jgi:hypothetical protein